MLQNRGSHDAEQTLANAHHHTRPYLSPPPRGKLPCRQLAHIATPVFVYS
jgi:hypothetical protein